jgi:hypothetical protein
MNKTNPIDEIHEIRNRIYEETKDMTPEERRKYFEDGSKEFEKVAEELQVSIPQERSI